MILRSAGEVLKILIIKGGDYPISRIVLDFFRRACAFTVFGA